MEGTILINLDEEKNGDLIEEWKKEAKEMTLEKLPDFLKKLTTEYKHDYGTICHAIASAGIAAMWAVERTPQGGITGFQSGCIIWDVIGQWETFGKGPKKMVSYENMLFPQYENEFQKTISKDTWEWIQEQAKENLEKTQGACSSVIEHWKSIVDGKIPFGYKVETSE